MLSLASVGRSFDDLVDNRCGEGFFIWVRPERFGYLLPCILTQEFEVIVYELVDHESFAVDEFLFFLLILILFEERTSNIS